MKSIWQQMVAEFVATFALVFIGAGSVVILAAGGASELSLLGIALAHGLVLAVMVSNIGHISGGHVNPAVTIGAWVAGKIETVRAIVYIVMQLAGAAAGAELLRFIVPESIWRGTSLGATLINNNVRGFSAGRGVALEAALTFFLVFTVFAAAVDDRGAFQKVGGLTIGLVLTFDILVGGFLTGASMNPARSFGPALVAGKWTDFWVYVAGPVSGGIVAAVLYWVVFLRNREVAAPREDVPIGGGPEEDLPDEPGAELAEEESPDEALTSTSEDIPEGAGTDGGEPTTEGEVSTAGDEQGI